MVMPTFGFCTGFENARLIADSGFDYIEPSIQTFFQGEVADAEYAGVDAVRGDCPLPVKACNMIAPRSMKLTGPDVDLDRIKTYLTRVMRRAGEAGVKTLVFGSGGARNIPDGTAREEARIQLIDFLSIAAPLAQSGDVTVVIEPLQRSESNVLNGVAETMTYVRELNHPNVRCLVDSYHHWQEGESLADVEEAGEAIHHVHVADKKDRVLPFVNESSNPTSYKAFFKTLKKSNYDGGISMECGEWPKEQKALEKSLAKLRQAWDAA